MEERKSNYQVIENGERDFQFSDSAAKNASSSKVKHYGRDLLLQLRLHPLSLQKPKTLPNMEVIKEKLYLHDINETCSTSNDRSLDNNHASLKPEYCNMKHDYRMLSNYFNRLYPYCFVPQGYNGSYQTTSSKFHPSFHTYCNPQKKHCVMSHQCYKDFPMEECLWTKRCFPTTEEMWNSYPSPIKKKEQGEMISKSKKKLPIIDPVTGKNVLENVTSMHEKEKSDTYPMQGNSVSSGNRYSLDTEEKYTGDYFYSTESNDKHLESSNEMYADSVACTSEDKICYDKFKNPSALYEDNIYEKFEDNSNHHQILYNDKSTLKPKNKKDENFCIAAKDETTSTADSTGVQENTHDLVKNSENINENSDISKIANKKVPKIWQNRENSHTDRHGSCQTQYKKDMHVCKESISKQNDLMREICKPKDKLPLKQEQQKMSILQSFLRFKKYQLEESIRNLDEKRIEIANWECNLYNKAKRLRDKELWLETQSEILFNRSQQLADREKMLIKEENNSSGDCLSSKRMFKETELPEKKFAQYNYNDTAWEEIPSKIKGNFKSDETYCGENTSSSNKVSEDVASNIEKCKSDTKSLDELERNIVFIEKMHSPAEIGDINLESKTELASNAPHKKDEIDPFSYSKGRRYLPEHIKYWLNKRDKNSS